MILSSEDLLTAIKETIGDKTDDASIKLLEDVTDTVADYEQKISGGGQQDAEDWKTKYEENDKMWRQKYRDRFFSPEPDVKAESTSKDTTSDVRLNEESEEPELKTKYEELFTSK